MVNMVRVVEKSFLVSHAEPMFAVDRRNFLKANTMSDISRMEKIGIAIDNLTTAAGIVLCGISGVAAVGAITLAALGPVNINMPGIHIKAEFKSKGHDLFNWTGQQDVKRTAKQPRNQITAALNP